MEVRIENLTKTFVGRKGQETVAVNNMTFTIPDGKLVGLLGPSGCGKSTTLYMIAGLHKPTLGSIYFGDDNVTFVPPENRGIGLVFQNYALYPHLSVRKNIAFPLDNIRPRLSRIAKDLIVHEMASLVDIENYLERKPKELSGGQQQRVAIARALSKRPRILLLDEPLSNLDARLRLQTREEIKRVQRETKITTVFVTHDQEEAMSISDIIIVMKDGIIQQIDEPQKVYDEPDNLFVAKFLGSPAINVLDGKIIKGKLYLQGKLISEDKIFQTPFHKKTYTAVKVIEDLEDETVAKKPEELKDEIVAKQPEESEDETVAQSPEESEEGAAEVEVVLVPKVSYGRVEIKEELFEDRDVKIAIRPEAFKLNEKGTIPVTIDYIEHIGRDISIIGCVAGQEDNHLKIIIPSELRSKVDAPVVFFDPKRLYVFEDDGTRLL